MTNKEFIEELSRRIEKTEKEIASLLASFTECVSQSLQENKTVVLQDFGSFEVEKKMEYISVNPVTKQRFLVPPELVVSFKSATSLKGRVKNVLSDE
ncbi:HU family DNA-binding protein [Phocaeicola plebeius]|uniref:HU family DNA-binding protein n=1 Tax=Phocaeicola plebeius TaxID=310297 RepID=UPI003FF02A3A